MTRRDMVLLALAALLIAAPLIVSPGGAEFLGADSQAQALIEETGYRPWFAPLWQPPSKEVESLIFAVQAALGAGLLGYVIGRRHGRPRQPPKPARQRTPAAPFSGRPSPRRSRRDAD